MTDDELGRYLQKHGLSAANLAQFEPLLETDADRDRILQVAARLLREGDSDVVWHTLLGLRQLARFDKYPTARMFYKRFVGSSAYQATLDMVFATELDKRESSIYMLGQFGSKAALPTLYRAFNKYCDTDPLILGCLTGEMNWLESGEETKGSEERYHQILQSPSYLCRWSILEMSAVIEYRPHILEQLATDSNSLVAAEARYIIYYNNLREEMSQATKGERKRRFKAAKEASPSPTYFGISNAFRRGHDWATHHGNYTLVDMETYILKRVDTN